jgi:hypothetical protein
MADPSISPPPAPPTPPSSQDQQTDFDIAEEYGTARKSLPPAGIVAICVAIVVAIVAVYALTNRAHPHSTGTIDDVVFVPMQGQEQEMVMVAVNISLQNTSQKPSWIQSIKAELDAGGNKFTDDATPAVDAQRYLQALPDLKQHALNLLTTETRINPGEKIFGTIVVSFPVKADVFASRKSLTVTVKPYDELAVVITK